LCNSETFICVCFDLSKKVIESFSFFLERKTIHFAIFADVVFVCGSAASRLNEFISQHTHRQYIHTHTPLFFSSSSILFSPPAGDGFQVLSPPLYVVCMCVCLLNNKRWLCCVFSSSSSFFLLRGKWNEEEEEEDRHTQTFLEGRSS